MMMNGLPVTCRWEGEGPMERIPCMLRDHERAASGRERNNQPWTRDPMMGAMAASMFSVLLHCADSATVR